MPSWITYASDGKTRTSSDLGSARKQAQQEADRTGKSAIIYPNSKSGKSGGRKTHHVYPSRKSNPAHGAIPCKLVPMKNGKFRVMVEKRHAARMNPTFRDAMGRKFRPTKVIFIGTGRLAGKSGPLYYFSNNVHDSAPEGGPYTTATEAKKAARRAGFKPDPIVVRY